MPATQISFAHFAAQALALHAVTPCPPSIVAVHAAASVVAHGGDDAGECITFQGVWKPPRVPGGIGDLRDDVFEAPVAVDWACGGLDAPRDFPLGSHRSLVLGRVVYADAYACRYGC